jgi:plastocyanin
MGRLYALTRRPASRAGECDTLSVRPVLRVVRAVAALGASAWLVAPALVASPAHAADQTVSVGTQTGDNKFAPSTVTVDPGDTVTWQWTSGLGHTVTSTSSNWKKDTRVGPQVPPNAPGDAMTAFTFTKPGTYTYWCRTHTSAMTGKVVVTGATTSPKPSKTPPHTSSPPPATSRPPSASASSTPSPDVTPTGSATVVLPSGSPAPSGVKITKPPQPSFVTQGPGGTPFLGVGGLTRQPASGRTKGLPVMLALILIGGVGSAELRALLANAPDA